MNICDCVFVHVHVHIRFFCALTPFTTLSRASVYLVYTFYHRGARWRRLCRAPQGHDRTRGNFPIYLFLVRLRIPQSKQTTDCDKKVTTTSQPNFFVQLRTKTIFQFFGLQLFGPQSEQLKIVGAFQSEDCDIVYVHVFFISRLFLGSGVVIRAPITFFFGRGAMESAATHCLNGLYLRNVTSSKRTPTRTVFLASTYLSPLERLGCR